VERARPRLRVVLIIKSAARINELFINESRFEAHKNQLKARSRSHPSTPKNSEPRTEVLSATELGDCTVMLKYTVECTNTCYDAVDIVVVNSNDRRCSIAPQAQGIAPGTRTSFEVIVFRQACEGKVYIYI